MSPKLKAMVAALIGVVLCGIAAVHAQEIFTPAERMWIRGQKAMHGKHTERAIGYYHQSLKLDPTLSRNHLSLAAAYLEKADDARACMHLGKYVRTHPHHVAMRNQYAELLMRLGRTVAASEEFSTCIAQTQHSESLHVADQIHRYRRLMEIAEMQRNGYRQHLYRGIALYLLAVRNAELSAPDERLNTASLLTKAAGQLSAARLRDRNKARPSWYLHLVWSKMGQSHMAERFLRCAQRQATFGDLTECEERELALAQRGND